MGYCTSQELTHRATVAEPGGQAPGSIVNGEALRLPQGILQPDNQGASASGPSRQKILPEKLPETLPIDSVRLNEAFNNALDMETTSLWPEHRWSEEIESDVAPRPVVFTGQNVPSISMDVSDGLKLADGRMAEW
jgi:hypothetical protein